MDDREVAQHWDANAADWTASVRAGHDLCREYVNNPAFFDMLGSLEGLAVIDLGCGEGYNTRRFAELGGRVIGVDISAEMISAARAHEAREPRGIEYRVGSVSDLAEFPDEQFDAALSTMVLMDVPDHEACFSGAYRVLKAGGLFQFSICHPCTMTRTRRWIYNDAGEREGLLIGDYWRERSDEPHRVEEWFFGAAPAEVRERARSFRVPHFYRTLSEYFNALTAAGFVVEQLHEPTVTEAVAEQTPYVADCRMIPEFLIFRCRKG